MLSNVPLSLSSEPRGWDENGIVIAVVRVLVAPCRLTLALLSLLPCGLRSPAASWCVLRTLRLTSLHWSRGAPLGGALCWGMDRRAAEGTGAGGVTRRLCGGGGLTLLHRGLGGSWGETHINTWTNIFLYYCFFCTLDQWISFCGY